MDRRYSPIIDMYGAASEDPSPRQKSHTWLYVLLTIAGFFVFESIRPVMRLRPDPPPSVMGASLNDHSAPNESQRRMAQTCWDYAAASLQDFYPYGRGLPQTPPPRLNDTSGKTSPITTLCWPRLRNAWTQRGSWVRSYEWSTDWLTSPDGPFQQTIFKILNRFGMGY
jgi:hypothetical protein